MSHTCSTTLVRCMDFRLGEAIRDHLTDKGLYNDIDIISVAGAAKDIAQQEGSYLEGQVALSKQLHEVKTIILMNHTDCGGYGGRGSFDSDEEERKTHADDLETAAAKLSSAYPDVTIVKTLAKISEGGGVEIEEIA